MQAYAYIIALVLSLAGLVILDKKYKLAFFRDSKKTVALLFATVIFFIAWDVAGIFAGVFATNPQWVSGLYLFTPNLPLEEFLFLTLFGYQIILLWRWRCLHTSV